MRIVKWFSVEHREEVHEKIQRHLDVFFGIEHRLRKEEMEEQFNKEAKEGWRFAASAARITDERASNEDRTHTSGGVLWQSTATWEQLWEQKKERLSRSQEMKEELPKHG